MFRECLVVYLEWADEFHYVHRGCGVGSTRQRWIRTEESRMSQGTTVTSMLKTGIWGKGTDEERRVDLEKYHKYIGGFL